MLLQKSLRRKLPTLLREYWVLLVVLTLLSLGFTIGSSAVLAPYPYGLPLFHADKPFWDFTVFAGRFAHFGTPEFWSTAGYPFTYPAPMALAFAVFYAIPGHALGAYLWVFVLWLAVCGWLLARAMVREGIRPWVAGAFVLTVGLTNWPIGYLINRANIEGIVAMFLAFGILAAIYGRPWLGASLIGVAGAMKLFPIILLALLFSKKQYRQVVWGLAVAAVVNVASLVIVGPSARLAQRYDSQGLMYFKEHWAELFLRTEIGFDHSLFGLAKFAGTMVRHSRVAWSVYRHVGVARWMRFSTAIPDFKKYLTMYMVAVAVGGVALYFMRIRKLPVLNQVLALTVCAVLLPPVSFDYTLVHLLIPFGLLCVYVVKVGQGSRSIAGLRTCMVCFAVVFTMDAFFTYQIRFAGQVRAVALSVLLYAVVRYPFAGGDVLPDGPPALSHPTN